MKAKVERIGFLLTTEVLFWHLRGKPEAGRLMRALAKAGIPCCSPLTLLELRLLDRTQDAKGRELMESLATVPITTEIAEKAAELMRNREIARQFTSYSEALLVATCLVEDLVLVTERDKRFDVPGLVTVEV